jgi:transposase-like protein
MQDAATKYDSAFVASIIAGVQGNPEEIRARVTDFEWPRYHVETCDLRKGRGPCTCNRRSVKAKMAIMKSFYNLAAAALSAEEENPFPAFGPPLKRTLRHPGGRPTKYTPELALQIGLLVTQGEQTIETALRICGVSRRSLKRWRKRHYLLDDLLRTLEMSRGVFPRRYHKIVLSPKKQRAARARRKRYVKQKAGRY